MSRVILVKLVKLVILVLYIGDGSDNGNVGKVGKIGKISNFGAIDNGSIKGNTVFLLKIRHGNNNIALASPNF